MIDIGFIPLTAAPKESLNKEVPERLNIPVITVEVSKEDDIIIRKEKYRSIFNKTLKYFEME